MPTPATAIGGASQVVDSIRRLTTFFLSGLEPTAADALADARTNNPAMLRSLAPDAATLRRVQALVPVLREKQQPMRAFGVQIAGRLSELQASRALGWVRDTVAAI